MGQVYQLFGSGSRTMVPIESETLGIGQIVTQAHRYETGVICETTDHGYTVIFADGAESTGQQVESLSPFTRITVRTDETATPDEVNRLIALRNAKRITDRWEREWAAEQKKTDVASCVAELRIKYPWADSSSPSKNLKKELSLAWPSVKFSVRYKSFSGGDDISVHWTDGPSPKQVEELSNKYVSGTFDAMTDCAGYDASAFGEAVSIVLGRSRFVNVSRKTSETLVQKAIDRVLTKYNGPRSQATDVTVERFNRDDLYNESPMENNDSHYWSFQSLIHRELSKMGMMPVQVTK